MSLGPGTVVPAPPATPPTISLLTAAGGGTEEADLRWENGIGFAPEGCGSGQVVSTCAGTTKTVPENAAIEEWVPYGLVAADRCSAFGWQSHDYVARATRKLLACESKMLAGELWTALVETANADYAFINAAELITAVWSPTAAIAQLEQASGGTCGCGGRKMIHMRPRIFERILATAPSMLRREGNRWLTGMDSIIVPDYGYPGTGPGAAAATVLAVNAATEFIYITNPVDVRHGPVDPFPGTLGEAMDRATNTVTYYAERIGVASYDVCCAYAIEVNPTLTVA